MKPSHEKYVEESVTLASSGGRFPGLNWSSGAVRPRGITVLSYGYRILVGLGGEALLPGSAVGGPLRATLLVGEQPGSEASVRTSSESATLTVSSAVVVSLPQVAVTLTLPPTMPAVVKAPALVMFP